MAFLHFWHVSWLFKVLLCFLSPLKIMKNEEKHPSTCKPNFSITLAISKKTEDRNQVLCFCAKSSSFALTEIWFDSIWLLVESTWSAWRQALKCYDCLLFSRIINSYLLVVVFELLVVRKRSRFLSAVIVNKKTKPDSGRVQCCYGGIFLPCFFWRNTLSCITPKENWYVY